MPDLAADPIDPLLALDPGARGIAKFFQTGGARRAADALRRARRVVLTTGFVVDTGVAETDGPPGAAVLGRALRALGAEVRYVTDAVTAPVLAAALAAVGIGVAPPPLQKVEEIKAYADFMGAHYGEEYYERDVKNWVDRFCLNRRDSHELGDDRTFAIVWRKGHVFKRVIKGGPINNPKQERAFLVCPGDFIVETVKGVGTKAMGAFPIIP